MAEPEMDEDLEFARARLLYLEMRIKFEQRESASLAAEIEAAETLLAEKKALLEELKAAVCERIKVLGIRPN